MEINGQPVSKELFNYILTQKSITGNSVYDELEKIINNAINKIKEKNINAKITNLVLNVNNKLVLAQAYIERKNGFVPTKENTFGTSPTIYNLQLHFPFGLESIIQGKPVCLPPGNLETLKPYKKPLPSYKIIDDVQYDFRVEDVVCGDGVRMENFEKNGKDWVTFSVQDTKNLNEQKESEAENESITISYNNMIGIGGIAIPFTFPIEYEFFDKGLYERRLCMAGIYPLFYSKGNGKFLLHYDNKYQAHAKASKQDYKNYITTTNNNLMETNTGQRWKENLVNAKNKYTFNLTMLNNTILFTETNLPLVRLRDYQLDLFYQCENMLRRIKPLKKRLPLNLKSESGIAAMGVGAGKTFFTFTLLQHIRHQIQKGKMIFAPPFCMTPTRAIGQVVAQTINRQGHNTATSAIVLSKKSQMPNEKLTKIYNCLTKFALKDAKRIQNFIFTDLQKYILNRCDAIGLHPSFLINFLYSSYKGKDLSDRLKLLKDSIDIKRILLLVEGQKMIMEKTGMLGVNALHNLLDSFNALADAISKENNLELLMRDASPEQKKRGNENVINFNFNITIELPTSMQGKVPGFNNYINIADISSEQFESLLTSNNTRGRKKDFVGIRDVLLNLACLKDKEAAILLANSGGLGNTDGLNELKRQIKKLLPIAYKAFHNLIVKKKFTPIESHRLYACLYKLFSTIPNKINIKKCVKQNDRKLYGDLLRENRQLVLDIRNKIQEEVNKLNTVSNCFEEEKISNDDARVFDSFSISQDSSAITAVDQLTGVMNLSISKAVTSNSDAADSLLTHIPVFTPKGLAAYIESLDDLVGNKAVKFQKECGIYTIEEDKRIISKKDIKSRLIQLFDSVMIADEIHEDSFKCLYDSNNPIYKRINTITKKYFHFPFSNLLPNRLGMTGTCNSVAKTAFGEKIYELSTSDMIKRRLMKEVNSTKLILPQTVDQYIQSIVVNYLSRNIAFLSKGLIFTGKSNNNEVKNKIIESFNLLLSTDFINTNRENLFEKINNKRTENGLSKLNSKKLKKLQQSAYQNHLFAIYIEYILSKSSAPKELSDIVGLQNMLFFQNKCLLDINDMPLDQEEKIHHKKDIELRKMNTASCQIKNLATSVDRQSITKQDIEKFLSQRIKGNPALKKQLIEIFFKQKNNLNTASKRIKNLNLPDQKTIVTLNQNEFEIGGPLAMLAGEAQRTGYSHEPVGIVADTPGNFKLMNDINQTIENLSSPIINNNKSTWFKLFQGVISLVGCTYSYHEKNQMGGRALRTPQGQVNYIESLTFLNTFIQKKSNEKKTSLKALQIETSFQDIFTEDEIHAQTVSASVTFNRIALEHLSICNKLEQYILSVRRHFFEKLTKPASRKLYENFIEERLLFLWAMHHKKDLVYQYLSNKNVNASYTKFIQQNLDKNAQIEEDFQIYGSAIKIPLDNILEVEKENDGKIIDKQETLEEEEEKFIAPPRKESGNPFQQQTKALYVNNRTVPNEVTHNKQRKIFGIGLLISLVIGIVYPYIYMPSIIFLAKLLTVTPIIIQVFLPFVLALIFTLCFFAISFFRMKLNNMSQNVDLDKEIQKKPIVKLHPYQLKNDKNLSINQKMNQIDESPPNEHEFQENIFDTF